MALHFFTTHDTETFISIHERILANALICDLTYNIYFYMFILFSFQEIYEAKRQDFFDQCQREEEELKQKFMQRVKEKETAFKESEKEASPASLI